MEKRDKIAQTQILRFKVSQITVQFVTYSNSRQNSLNSPEEKNNNNNSSQSRMGAMNIVLQT